VILKIRLKIKLLKVFLPVNSTVCFGLMVFNATFNNISAISWLSVLLVEETGVPGENNSLVTSHWQTFHNVVSYTPHHERVVIAQVVVNPITIRSRPQNSYRCVYLTVHVLLLEILKSERVEISSTGLTLPYFCVCPKPRPGLPITYVKVFFMFNCLRWEFVVCFVDIGWIVDHHSCDFTVSTFF